jgi:hypothetical protein
MLEKWLKMGVAFPPDVRKTIVQNLRRVHSAWTNWYLGQERYEEAQKAVSKAIKWEFTPVLAIKWTLTHVAPAFTKKISPAMRV